MTARAAMTKTTRISQPIIWKTQRSAPVPNTDFSSAGNTAMMPSMITMKTMAAIVSPSDISRFLTKPRFSSSS